MFGWLTRRFRRRGWDRTIFSYWDGSRWRRIDPIPASTALDAALGQRVGEVLATLTTAMPPNVEGIDLGPLPKIIEAKKLEAGQKLAAAACVVFNVKELSDTEGMTAAARIQLVTRFLVWLHQCAEDMRPFGNSPGQGVQPIRRPSPTESSSGSGSSGGPSPASSPTTTPKPSRASSSADKRLDLENWRQHPDLQPIPRTDAPHE